MKFLRRILPSPRKREQEDSAKTTVHRRVEVTVDREVVSILTPAQPRRSPDKTGHSSEPVEQGPEQQPLAQAGDGSVARKPLPHPDS
jgi:hypothetical protein